MSNRDSRSRSREDQQPVQLTMGQLQQLLNAINSNNALAQAAAVNQPQQAPPSQFAMTPSLVDTANPIDYSTSDGKKLYKNAVEPLPIKYDLEPESTNTFNELLKDKCESTGWNSPNANILTIPVNNGTEINLIEGYGRLTMAQVENHCRTYINQETRAAQHQYQMYECLMKSLTDSACRSITAEKDKYQIDGRKCGPLLYKHLMNKAVVDTRATLSHIRENLANLDSYITTVNSNITMFNEYVNQQRIGLQVRGGVTHDLLTNLWKAYTNVSDNEFVQYIKRKKDAYDDGTEITEDSLMTDAENKYKTLLIENKWNSLSPEQTQIVALASQVHKLQNDKLKFNKVGNKIKTKPTNKSEGNNQNKTKKKNKKQNDKDKKWAWKKDPPNNGEPQEKVVYGTKYYWCDDHKLWTLTKHTEENCNIRKQQHKSSSTQSSEAKTSLPADRSLTSAELSFASQIHSILKE